MRHTIAARYRRTNVRHKATSALRESCMLIENRAVLQFVARRFKTDRRSSTRVANKPARKEGKTRVYRRRADRRMVLPRRRDGFMITTAALSVLPRREIDSRTDRCRARLQSLCYNETRFSVSAGLRQGVQQRIGAHEAQADAQRREEIRVHDVRQGVQAAGPLVSTD